MRPDCDTLPRMMDNTALDDNSLPTAVCVVRRDDDIFVCERADPTSGMVFYRPLGGSLGLGERGHDAVARAIREEVNVEVSRLRYLGSIENLGPAPSSAREIVLVYDGALNDPAIYAASGVEAYENGAIAFKGVWKPLADFAAGHALLRPDGLLELLEHDDEPLPFFGFMPASEI